MCECVCECVWCVCMCECVCVCVCMDECECVWCVCVCFVCESEMALESSVVGEGAVSGMSVCVYV